VTWVSKEREYRDIITNNEKYAIKRVIIHIIAILFIFPLMFKTDIFHIMWAHDMIPIIANR
jgi:hypothetical protein